MQTHRHSLSLFLIHTHTDIHTHMHIHVSKCVYKERNEREKERERKEKRGRDVERGDSFFSCIGIYSNQCFYELFLVSLFPWDNTCLNSCLSSVSLYEDVWSRGQKFLSICLLLYANAYSVCQKLKYSIFNDYVVQNQEKIWKHSDQQ